MASHSFLSVAVLALAFISQVYAQLYVNPDLYLPSNFFSRFSFFTDNDPTNGFVDYKSQSDAFAMGIASQTSDYVQFGADSSNKVTSGRGRASTRLESLAVYDHGLFILDIPHMPGPACGAWPSFFTYGDNWPVNGEIDVIEGTNSLYNNMYTIHTAGPENTCTIDNQQQTGIGANRDCGTYTSAGVFTPVGCNIHSGAPANIGASFNANGGGVYAVQWTSNFIKIWFFPRNNIPASIRDPRSIPDICEFGTPDASFHGCQWDKFMRSQRLGFTNTFCGDYAGQDGIYPGPAGACALQCDQEVAQNPQNYAQSYWQVRSIRIWQENTLVSNLDSPTCSSNETNSGSNHGGNNSSSNKNAGNTNSETNVNSKVIVNVNCTSGAQCSF